MQIELKNNMINVFGENIAVDQNCGNITLEQLLYLINSNLIIPIFRFSVLNEDETVKYIIPNSDIVSDSVQYSENYQNQSRRVASFGVINNQKNVIDYKINSDGNLNRKSTFKMIYTPNVNGLWYGTKIKYEIGFEYDDNKYYFSKGIYRISDFQFKYGSGGRTESTVIYSLQDKYSLFSGNSGVVIDGIEIPVGSSVEEVIKTVQNIPCADGTIYDIKDPIVNNRYFNFKTQQTISISEGGRLSDIYDSLSTQMSAENFYNSNGHLMFQPIDESLNEINKPVICHYTIDDLQEINLQGDESIINVVKVVGNNINSQQIYTGVAKNTNLKSPINIYYIKERSQQPIENQDIYSNKQANELAEYYLKQKTIMQFNQTIPVPFNPLLTVNNIIEITCEKLNMHKKRFLIKSIQYSGGLKMTLEVTNLDHLPTIGGIN